ncbi:MAG: hypothetical protein CMC82_04800 [Flavobacteriaceae bacterium]|nr:hypothetical protein [Flavobacteriaceae bacterium]|tara:strand:+ start:1224 stop:2636 length:1413 start_codon:yes stop_codon:yes gene_type:complete
MPFNKNFQIPEGKAASLKDKQNGFSDPAGVYPKQEYDRVSSVNEIARGFRRVNVELGGSVADIDFDLTPEAGTEYPNAQVKETASGHIIEYNDTPGGERVMIRHAKGSGVEMRADGTVIYSARKNTIRVTACDEKVIVDGDGELQYNGNLKLKVAGDFDLEVGGDFNVDVKGDMEQKIRRGLIQDIAGSVETEIVGGKNETIGGASTSLIHGNKNNIIKGSFAEYVQVDHNHAVGGTLVMTAENQVTLSTKRANITASKLVALGDSGTIGGGDIIYYGNVAHINRVNSTSMHATQGFIANVGMTAPVFNGNLSGNASTAGTALTAQLGTAAGSTTDPVTITNASDSNPTDLLTNSNTIINDALEKSGVAIKRVHIDEFSNLYHRLDRTAHYGGVSNVELNTRQARSKLRDPNNLNNETFISALLADGTISSYGTRLTPLSTGRIVSGDKSPRRGVDPIGRSLSSGNLYKA